IEITCDHCGKIYRVNENKIKGDTARLKCNSCAHIITVSKLGLEESVDSYSSVAEISSEEEITPNFVKKKTHFSLFVKIILVMLLVSLIPMAIFWGVTYKENTSRIRNDTQIVMSLTAHGLENQINGWIDNNIWVLKSAAKLPSVISMNQQNQEPVLQQIQKKYPYIYLAFTVGLDGSNVARSDDVPLKYYGDRQYFKDIIEGKKLSWQTLIGKTSKKPALVMAVPIMQEDNLVGVIAAGMNVDEISKHIARWKKGTTGFAFLVDDQDKVVAHQVKQYALKQKKLSSHPLVAPFRKGGWTTKTSAFKDENGKNYMGHIRKINYGWALAIQQEEQEVFASLKRLQTFAITLLFVTIVLVLLIAWISAKAIVTPIKKLTEVAERMSLGDLNMKIKVPSTDEIGFLAQAIKRMQTSLHLAMERLRQKR
ncbi:MAG: zinc-ribbon domain-containing protein, partial [Deltaproteobacteria bacterium]|nr:zinc-ribbon domain-containing protein [Deltaproteobacteria bacterium]